jgi:predicted PurR-regulated permease PerM
MAVPGEHTAERALWLGVGAVITALIGLALFKYVGALVAAIFLYYSVRPVHRRIDARVGHSNVAVMLTVFVLVLPMLIVVGYALFLIGQELNSVLSGGALKPLRPYFQPYLRLVRQGEFQQLREAVTGPSGIGGSTASAALGNALGRFSNIAAAVLSVLTRFFLMTIFLFYLLRDGDELRDWFYRSVDYDDRIVEFLDGVDDDIETVFFNNLAFIVFTALQAAVIYLALNLLVSGGTLVGTPVLLGALIGIGTLVPVIGMKLIYLPYAAYLGVMAATTATPTWHPIVFLAVSAVIVDTIPDLFIRPYLSGRGSLHVGLVMLGYFLGTLAFGWWGLFFGPILVVLAVHFAKSVFPWLASSYLRG